jgi:hypothetical protein
MRRHIKVYFNNGDIIETEINGTKQEIANYYFQNEFNLGSGGNDLMVRATKVEFLN